MKEKKEKIWIVVKRLYKYVEYSNSRLFLMALMLAGGTIGGIFLAATIGNAIQLVSEGKQFNFATIVLPIIIAAIIQLSTSYIYVHLSGHFSSETHRQLANLTLKKLLSSKQHWIESQKSGDLINKSGESLGLGVNLLTYGMPELFDVLIAIILMATYLTINNWKLALLYFIFYPLVIYMQNAFSKPINKTVTARLDASGKCGNISIDAMRNLTTVKAYGLEKEMTKRYSEKGIILQGKFKRFYWMKSIVCFIGEAFSVLPTILVSFGAVYLVSKGELEVGALLAFIIVMLRLNSPLRYFGRQMSDLRGDVAGALRVLELIESPQEDRSKSITIPKEGSEIIRFNNVSFSYDGENMVLENIDFTLHKGEHIAIVGESGCGKSTLLKLIGGLYDNYTGNISILGNDMNNWNLVAMRTKMAHVSQRSDLFPVSIYENIIWGSEGKNLDDVKKACQFAGILPFVLSLPETFDTLAGERGIQLSGGQKQRVSIARALLRDSKILLLDEATSSLDATTEREVQASLNKLMEGKSTVIVSHRLSSIRNVSKIIVIDKGKIIETGTHKQLLDKKGMYYKLYKRQIGEGLS